MKQGDGKPPTKRTFEKKYSKRDGAAKKLPDQREVKRQRQMSRPHYDTVVRAKQIWNIVRERDVSKEKRTPLIEELMELVRGKMFEIAAKHDASRVVQCLLKYGTPEQRNDVIKELASHVLELSKMQYGYFLVQKMLKYGTNDNRKLIVNEMTGHVIKLGTHNVAANVLETANEYLKPGQMTDLKLEFYGKEFSYFKSESKRNLKEILKESPSKKEDIMKHIETLLNKMIDKKLLGFAYVHNLLWEYMCEASTKQIIAIIPNIRDATVALLSTKAGAKAAVQCLSYGNAKDRKRVIKSLKDKVIEACNHPSGYLVLLRLLDVVDDTVLVQKSIISELLPHLYDIACHIHGKKVLLQLFSPLNTTYLNPEELELLQPPYLPESDSSEKLVVNYKKDPAVRRSELLKGLISPLEEMCISNMDSLMRSKNGFSVLFETCKQSNNENLFCAIIDSLEVDGGSPIYSDAIGHRSIQKLVSEEANETLRNMLVELVQSHFPKWVESNRGSFVVISILKSVDSKRKQEIKKILKPKLPSIKELAKELKGSQILLDLLN